MKTHQRGEDPAWYREGTRHECKYGADVGRSEMFAWNYLVVEGRSFSKIDPDDPDFDIKIPFASPIPEPHRTSDYVRESV